jgi:hypothetical protein
VRLKDDVLAADGDQALGRLVIGTEILGVALADSLLQLGGSAGRRVLGEILFERANAACLMLSGWEVGLARSKIHHVHALRAQLFGVRRHLHGGGTLIEEIRSAIGLSLRAWVVN